MRITAKTPRSLNKNLPFLRKKKRAKRMQTNSKIKMKFKINKKLNLIITKKQIKLTILIRKLRSLAHKVK